MVNFWLCTVPVEPAILTRWRQVTQAVSEWMQATRWMNDTCPVSIRRHQFTRIWVTPIAKPSDEDHTQRLSQETFSFVIIWLYWLNWPFERPSLAAVVIITTCKICPHAWKPLSMAKCTHLPSKLKNVVKQISDVRQFRFTADVYSNIAISIRMTSGSTPPHGPRHITAIVNS